MEGVSPARRRAPAVTTVPFELPGSPGERNSPRQDGPRPTPGLSAVGRQFARSPDRPAARRLPSWRSAISLAAACAAASAGRPVLLDGDALLGGDLVLGDPPCGARSRFGVTWPWRRSRRPPVLRAPAMPSCSCWPKPPWLIFLLQRLASLRSDSGLGKLTRMSAIFL